MAGWEVVKEAPIATAPTNNSGWDVSSEGAAAPMPWGDVGAGIKNNFIDSAKKFGTDIVHPFVHPVETAQNLGSLASGLGEKAVRVGAQATESGLRKVLPESSFGSPDASANKLSVGSNEKNVDAVGQFLADRYGGMENLKRTLATDPVGFAADLSLALTGGGTAVARLPGVVGKVGEIAATTGRAVDPLTSVGLAAKGAGAVGSELVGGLALQTGGAPLRAAYHAGQEGGDAASAFQQNLRGTVPASETVDAAKVGLSNMVKERGSAYRKEMASLGLDRTVLDFDKIDDAITKSTDINTFRGIDLSPSTSEVRSRMAQAIQEWKHLPPDEFHTPEGMDALKRKLSDIYEGTEYGTPERKAAGDIYRSVRQTIIDQAPQYKGIMEGYEESSDIIKQMEKTLSLNPNASIDTSLRKLQSVLRDNVSTAYGHRKELAEYLINAGAPNLIERLAGQALQPMLPRGLGRLGLELGAFMHPMHALYAGGVASPRLMGEGAYYAGKSEPYIHPAASASFQAGRTSDLLNQGSASISEMAGR